LEVKKFGSHVVDQAPSVFNAAAQF
jgi:hypothetical protein